MVLATKQALRAIVQGKEITREVLIEEFLRGAATTRFGVVVDPAGTTPFTFGDCRHWAAPAPARNTALGAASARNTALGAAAGALAGGIAVGLGQ